MLDLEEELRRVIDALDAAAVAYALCGGLAVAVHGHPRATIDVDLLMPCDGMLPVTGAAENGTRLFDVLVVTPQTQFVWDSRQTLMSCGRRMTVVSRDGLIALKHLRASPLDLVDITRLPSTTIDMSAKAVTTRIRRASQLRKLCLSLAKAKPLPAKPKS